MARSKVKEGVTLSLDGVRLSKYDRYVEELCAKIRGRYLGGAMNIANYYFYCGSSHSIMAILLK